LDTKKEKRFKRNKTKTLRVDEIDTTGMSTKIGVVTDIKHNAKSQRDVAEAISRVNKKSNRNKRMKPTTDAGCSTSSGTPVSSPAVEVKEFDISYVRSLCKSHCKDCGGSGICTHGRQKSLCKDCGGSGFCTHGRQKSRCKDCGGSGFCTVRVNNASFCVFAS